MQTNIGEILRQYSDITNIMSILAKNWLCIGNIWIVKHIFLKYLSYIKNVSNVKLMLLWYWHNIANIFIVNPVFLLYWFYIINISNVRQYFYDIGTSLEIFSMKGQFFRNTGLHSQYVKPQCWRCISCKYLFNVDC